MLKNTIRRRAQTAAPILKECQDCGATDKLQRHHPDYGKPDQFEILCLACHIKADQRDGHRPKKQPKDCAICGAEFMPSHNKKHKTCGPGCLSELGRRNAMKRWDNGPSSQTSRA